MKPLLRSRTRNSTTNADVMIPKKPPFKKLLAHMAVMLWSSLPFSTWASAKSA